MPARRLVLIVDEIARHRHPLWQRTILPATLDIDELLDGQLRIQVAVSTHSPFVLASLETSFDTASVALYHLRLEGARVRLRREEFQKHGDVSSWLTAPIFGWSTNGIIIGSPDYVRIRCGRLDQLPPALAQLDGQPCARDRRAWGAGSGIETAPAKPGVGQRRPTVTAPETCRHPQNVPRNPGR